MSGTRYHSVFNTPAHMLDSVSLPEDINTNLPTFCHGKVNIHAQRPACSSPKCVNMWPHYETPYGVNHPMLWYACKPAHMCWTMQIQSWFRGPATVLPDPRFCVCFQEHCTTVCLTNLPTCWIPCPYPKTSMKTCPHCATAK